MEVFLAIRRKKNTIFLDCPAEGKILDLKLMVEGITKILPENQMLWNNNKQLLDTQTFAACDINPTTANVNFSTFLYSNSICFEGAKSDDISVDM